MTNGDTRDDELIRDCRVGTTCLLAMTGVLVAVDRRNDEWGHAR